MSYHSNWLWVGGVLGLSWMCLFVCLLVLGGVWFGVAYIAWGGYMGVFLVLGGCLGLVWFGLVDFYLLRGGGFVVMYSMYAQQ